MRNAITNVETIIREREAVELERLFGKTKIDFCDEELVNNLFNRTMKRFQSASFALTAVYFMGYTYGVRAERKRRDSVKV